MKFLHFDFDSAIEKMILLILATVLFYIFYRIVKRIVKHLFDNYYRLNLMDNARILTLSRLILSICQYFTIFLYVYTILGIFGLPIGRLLTGAGIIGVALGFAGRDLMSDVINGFFIIVERQVNIGDTVYFKNLDITGKVSAISIRSLTLTSASNGTTFIPNRNIIALSNLSRTTTSLFVDVPVTLDTVTSLKQRVLSVNETYENVDFLGMVTLEDTVYLRSKISGRYEDISSEQANLLAAYYEKND
ncbi:MAG: mechanosensitive ion channel family protein [Lactococcus plantarum]|nr:mechanosensitive ion channel family protein [Lactococcus plantarum]